MSMIEALIAPAFRWSIAIYWLAIWAVIRIAERASHTSGANSMIVAAGAVSSLAFAVLFVLAARFPFWVVLASAIGAGLALFALVWWAAASSDSHDNMGAAILLWGAMVMIPIALGVPALLAWLAARHPPSPLTFRILLGLAGLAWLAPALWQAWPALRAGPFWSVARRHPVGAARILAVSARGDRPWDYDPVQEAISHLPLSVQMRYALGGDEHTASLARNEVADAVETRPSEAIPMVLAEIERAGGATAPAAAGWLFGAVSRGRAVDDPRVREVLLKRLATENYDEDPLLGAHLESATLDRDGLALRLVDCLLVRPKLSLSLFSTVVSFESPPANARVGKAMVERGLVWLVDDRSYGHQVKQIAKDSPPLQKAIVEHVRSSQGEH